MFCAKVEVVWDRSYSVCYIIFEKWQRFECVPLKWEKLKMAEHA